MIVGSYRTNKATSTTPCDEVDFFSYYLSQSDEKNFEICQYFFQHES